MGTINDIGEECTYIIGCALASLSLTVSLIARYAYFEHFPVSAVMNIGATFFFSFLQIGLASIDIAFTKKRKAAIEAGT